MLCLAVLLPIVVGLLALLRPFRHRASRELVIEGTTVLTSLIVFAYSRRREYAADAGSAKLLGSPFPMIAALRRLGNLQPGTLPDSLKAFGIAEGRRTSVWSTHPSLEDRIAALQKVTSF